MQTTAGRIYDVASLAELPSSGFSRTTMSFSTASDGGNIQYSFENQTNTPLQVFSASGEPIMTVYPKSRSGGSGIMTPGFLLSYGIGNYVNERGGSGRDIMSGSVLIQESAVATDPVVIKELGIIIAAGRAVAKVAKFDDALDRLFTCNGLVSWNGEVKELPPMILWHNVETEIPDLFYLALDSTIVAIPSMRNELVPAGHICMNVVDASGGGAGTNQPFSQPYRKMQMEPDGCIVRFNRGENGDPSGTIYVLSDNHQMLVQYIESISNLRDTRVMYDPGGVEVISRLDHDRLMAAALLDSRGTISDLTKKVADLTTDLEHAKRRTVDLEKDKKALYAAVSDLQRPETVREKIAQKDDERLAAQTEKELAAKKSKIEITKQGIGIVTGVVGLFTLLAAPLKAVFNWFASRVVPTAVGAFA